MNHIKVEEYLKSETKELLITDWLVRGIFVTLIFLLATSAIQNYRDLSEGKKIYKRSYTVVRTILY